MWEKKLSEILDFKRRASVADVKERKDKEHTSKVLYEISWKNRWNF